MKLSTKTNRFPHTFSKARALECNYSVYVTRPCPASSGWYHSSVWSKVWQRRAEAAMDRRNVRKIFIQRDYSRGTGVRFSTDFPRELTGKVCHIFKYTHSA